MDTLYFKEAPDLDKHGTHRLIKGKLIAWDGGERKAIFDCTSLGTPGTTIRLIVPIYNILAIHKELR